MTHCTPGSLRPRLFPIGRLLATPAAVELLHANGQEWSSLIDRHTTGDWGDLCAEDAAQNDAAVKQPYLPASNRILSAYAVGKGRIWVITEWDRSVTTILTPDEY